MQKYLVVLVIIAVSYAVGRYTTPEKVITEIKTIEVEKIVTKVERKKIYIKDKPDGSRDTVIVVDTNTDETVRSDETSRVKEVIKKSNTLNVSALAGMDITSGAPAFGLSAQKNVLGPITLGAWGLNNGNVGVSVGVSF